MIVSQMPQLAAPEYVAPVLSPARSVLKDARGGAHGMTEAKDGREPVVRPKERPTPPTRPPEPQPRPTL